MEEIKGDGVEIRDRSLYRMQVRDNVYEYRKTDWWGGGGILEYQYCSKSIVALICSTRV
jgi:hypothetical protein